MQLLRRHFGIRDCKELLPQGCLAMHIGLCTGPCINGEGYAEQVRAVKKILDGEATELLEELVKRWMCAQTKCNLSGQATTVISFVPSAPP